MFQKNIPTIFYVVVIYIFLNVFGEVTHHNFLLFNFYKGFTAGWLLKILAVIATIIELRKTPVPEQVWSYILLFFMGTLIFESRNFQEATFYFMTFTLGLSCVLNSKYFRRRQQNQ